MMQRKQDYVTLPKNNQRNKNASSVEESVDIAYQPASIAAEFAASMPVAPNAINSGDLSGYVDSPHAAVGTSTGGDGDETAELRPIALVIARARTAKKVLQITYDSGFTACAVYTQDHARDSYLKYAQASVCLGDKYSPALFCNSYAVLEAADESGCQVVVLCDEALPLAEVDSFLARAAYRNIQVYRLLNPDAPELGWLQCKTNQPPMDNDNWVTCPHCGLKYDEPSFASGHYICPSCKGYLRMTSTQRIDDFLDADSFVEWDRVVAETDPLNFPGYLDKLSQMRESSGLEEAVCTGEGRIAGIRFALGIMDSTFMMGSMGSVVGEKICRLVDRAVEERLPLVIFTASGGARMQESLISLMQMAKISCAIERHAAAGLLYISVLTDPTTGGVTASFAMQGDIILAEPQALIGFAGQRVIRDTIRQELPEGFQTAEFALEHGLIDAIVERENLRETIAHIMALHLATEQDNCEEGQSRLLIDYASLCDNLEHGTSTYNTITYGDLNLPEDIPTRGGWGAQWIDRISGLSDRLGSSPRKLEREVAKRTGSSDVEGGASLDAALHGADNELARIPSGKDEQNSNPAWESVQLARNVHRPTAMAYVNAIAEGFIELHGDRMFGDDGAIVGGIGWIDGRAVTIIAEEKGADLKDRIRRNFGCPQPEGYRKSLRLMRQAEKFGRPVVCFVDTQGAFCGMDSEERGQGNAIADNLLALAGLRVPVVSVFVGEGGSGGALALALADRVAMQKHAVYSVISPEGFASILWKDRDRAPEAAAVMKMSADESLELGIIDAVLSEGAGPAHENPDEAIENVHVYISESLDDLSDLTADELVAARQERFRKF